MSTGEHYTPRLETAMKSPLIAIPLPSDQGLGFLVSQRISEPLLASDRQFRGESGHWNAGYLKRTHGRIWRLGCMLTPRGNKCMSISCHRPFSKVHPIVGPKAPQFRENSKFLFLKDLPLKVKKKFYRYRWERRAEHRTRGGGGLHCLTAQKSFQSVCMYTNLTFPGTLQTHSSLICVNMSSVECSSSYTIGD